MHPKTKVDIMKKIFFIFFAGLMLYASKSIASSRIYSVIKLTGAEQPVKPDPHGGGFTPKMPACRPFIVDINEDTGDLYIIFNRSIEDVHISILGNEAIIDEDTESVLAGQIIMFHLGNYEEGQYTLTIESNDEVLSQYIIFIDEE